jgi:hypothetical protein
MLVTVVLVAVALVAVDRLLLGGAVEASMTGLVALVKKLVAKPVVVAPVAAEKDKEVK